MSSLLSEVKSAAKTNLIPGLILQSFALLIVFLYFKVPATAPAFLFAAELKLQYPSVFAIVSTSIFGGLLPYLFLIIKGKVLKNWLYHLLFFIVVWAFMGWLIDSFYVLQSDWFGNNNEWQTVLKKTLTDQFIFSVFITSPLITLLYMWRETEFNFSECIDNLRSNYLFHRLPATIVSTWCVWLPAVVLIYTMPSSLQLPLFNLVLCFFVLLLSALGKD
ncbi:hypothetical protein ISG33_16155 [Glaciecola sp. MH2013]|uniref:hypothetical protein n=1 Tax=Glaciecola sp. MH2013 TaxID=2785524 RepID=UPI00189EC749|nr:hypothetical protein [Glaciecola sp. MH2013]MBF7074936.1 hypothetical protein [Glaciecola sp. MH2013]